MNEEKQGALTSSAARLSSTQPTTSLATNTQHSAPLSSIPASTPSYKSFEHIRCPKQRRAKEYEQHLLILRDMYPEYSGGIEQQLAYARGQQGRTKASDRARVIKALEPQSLTCRELSEDLEMPYATCYKILKGMLETGAVAAYEHKGRAGNKPYLVYSLPH